MANVELRGKIAWNKMYTIDWENYWFTVALFDQDAKEHPTESPTKYCQWAGRMVWEGEHKGQMAFRPQGGETLNGGDWINNNTCENCDDVFYADVDWDTGEFVCLVPEDCCGFYSPDTTLCQVFYDTAESRYAQRVIHAFYTDWTKIGNYGMHSFWKYEESTDDGGILHLAVSNGTNSTIVYYSFPEIPHLDYRVYVFGNSVWGYYRNSHVAGGVVYFQSTDITTSFTFSTYSTADAGLPAIPQWRVDEVNDALGTSYTQSDWDEKTTIGMGLATYCPDDVFHIDVKYSASDGYPADQTITFALGGSYGSTWTSNADWVFEEGTIVRKGSDWYTRREESGNQYIYKNLAPRHTGTLSYDWVSDLGAGVFGYELPFFLIDNGYSYVWFYDYSDWIIYALHDSDGTRTDVTQYFPGIPPMAGSSEDGHLVAEDGSAFKVYAWDGSTNWGAVYGGEHNADSGGKDSGTGINVNGWESDNFALDGYYFPNLIHLCNSIQSTKIVSFYGPPPE